MMNIRTFMLASVAIMAVATPALAQDAASPFSGFYGGVEIGAARPQSKATVTPLTGAATSRTSNTTRLDYGAFGGYGHTFDNGLYLAGELSLNQTSGKSKPFSLSGVSILEKGRHDLSGTARVGYVFDDSILVYGLAGRSQRETRFSVPGVGTLPTSLSRKATLTGTTFGIGAAYALSENLFVRGEIDRTDYGKKSFTTAGLPGLRYEPQTTRFSIGIGYSF